MSSLIGEKDRKIVPRWRGFRASSSQRAQSYVAHNEHISGSLQANINDWKLEGSLWTALDVVAGAIVEGRLDLAGDALQRIRVDPLTPAAALAIVDEHERNSVTDDSASLPVEQRCREQIRSSRSRLATYPYDAIEWIDLAHSFTTLGALDKAQRCVIAAMTLAPEDVFVLRAASRFFIQQRDPERAQWILTKCRKTLTNPWLLASEIAAASVAGRESQLLKIGSRLEKADFRAEDLTELRAALGTSELDAGSTNNGKKLLRRSLQGANENSLAQIQWMDRTRLGNIIDISNTRPPQRHEVGAWRAFFEGKWDKAAERALLWFEDQPFSSNAGIFCSFVLSDFSNQHQQALDILKIARKANPENHVLLNNLAFTYIQLNRLDEAEKVLTDIQIDPESPDDATVEATVGMLAFRRGQTIEGRAAYNRAMVNLQRKGQTERAGIAAIYLALEEVRARTTQSAAAMKLAMDLTSESNRPDVAMKLEQLKRNAQAWLDEDHDTLRIGL